MPFANVSPVPEAAAIFSTVLVPHRSLDGRGFRIVMSVLALLSLGVGTTFFLLGAWPVPGFLGLDVLAVYLAFRLSFRSGRASEEITVSRERLTVRRVGANGRAKITDINPYWAKLEIRRWPPFGITQMAIASHGRSLPIGNFLGPGEREILATELSAALAKARAGSAP